MAEPNEKKPTNDVFNVPNQLTAARFILAIVVFVLIPLQIYLAALIVFLIAASTDWIDGYYARKYGQVTKFGRMFDPFVDKIIICGTFIFLAGEQDSGIAAWMAVVVVGRELLVTEKENPALIAGLRVRLGDDVFDSSVSGRLATLRRQ